MLGSRSALRLVGIILAAISFLTAQGHSQSSGTAFLDLAIVVVGSGSDPDLAETANAEQSWHYVRTISGYREMNVIRETIGSGANERRIIRFVPKPKGKSNVSGLLVDSAYNTYRDFGEGSYFDYVARESWSVSGQLPGELGGDGDELSFTLDLGKNTWDATLFPTTWLQALDSMIPAYEGEAFWTPSQGEGWSYYINDEADRTGPDLKYVSTRYHPGGSSAALFVPNMQLLNVVAVTNGNTYSGQKAVDIPRPQTAVGSWKMTFSIGWTLRETLPDVELKVTSRDYERWRPTAEPGPKPGKPLRMVARLVSPSGADLSNVRMERVDWKLVNTSREPGIALNYPPDSSDVSFDLKLTDLPTRNEGQEATHFNPPGKTSAVFIEPYDWGGWTTLNVEAQLNDGRVIKGKMDVGNLAFGPTENIRIPRTYSDSRIAIEWQRQNGAVDMWDDEDSEKLPLGKPGADGDGLSVYEEYRGFYVGGKHVSTDPRKKDLFIFNDTKSTVDSFPIVERAVSRFESISGLNIRKLKSGELSSAEINRNRSQGPTKGKQAYLWLRPTRAYPRPNDKINPGARPGRVSSVPIPDWSANIGDAAPMFDKRGSLPASAGLEHMVLQALFQCVSVDRPGPSDKVGSFRFIPGDPATGRKPAFELGPTRVLLIDFFGADFAEQFAAVADRADKYIGEPLEGETAAQTANRVRIHRDKLKQLRLLVGQKGGAHSGPEECLMRDWFADVYRSSLPSVDGRPVYRLIDRARGAETPGSQLGSTRQGTGINDPGRLPEPRYGNSSVAQPANKQMVVSDTAP